MRLCSAGDGSPLGEVGKAMCPIIRQQLIVDSQGWVTRKDLAWWQRRRRPRVSCMLRWSSYVLFVKRYYLRCVHDIAPSNGISMLLHQFDEHAILMINAFRSPQVALWL